MTYKDHNQCEKLYIKTLILTQNKILHKTKRKYKTQKGNKIHIHKHKIIKNMTLPDTLLTQQIENKHKHYK